MIEEQALGTNTVLVDRLAEALTLRHQIPDGIQLVAPLGDGTEANNEEALRTWVRNTLPQYGHLRGHSLFEALSDRLLGELMYFLLY